MISDLSPQKSALPPVERDEGMNREYIPLPGGWEIQTKGAGSTFRIADTKSGQQWAIIDASHPGIFAQDKAEMLARMAREVRAAYMQRDAELHAALNAIYAPVIKQNNLGAQWHPDVFGELMSGLQMARAVIAERQP